MICVKVFKSGDTFTGFVSEGHAEYAEEGYDIICSAVSVLTINTCNSLEQLTEDDFTVDAGEDGGYMRLTLAEPSSKEAQLLMHSLVIGLEAIEESYGNRFLHVQITSNEN